MLGRGVEEFVRAKAAATRGAANERSVSGLRGPAISVTMASEIGKKTERYMTKCLGLSEHTERGHLTAVIILVALGFVLRVLSIGWNLYEHGDVAAYSVAAESLATRGDFLLSADTSGTYFYSLAEKGGRYLAHNPLWPVLGSGIVALSGVSGYRALQMLSLVSGTALLILLHVLAERLGGPATALLTLSCAAFSYALIDFSANGSFYMFQAVLYLAFLRLVADIEKPYRAFGASITIGLAILLNQQNIVVLIAYVAYLLLRHGGGTKRTLGRVALCAAIVAVIYAPWWSRNYALFGVPFFSIDMTYVWRKLGLRPVVKGDVITYVVTPDTYLLLFKRSLLSWLPYNAYFINRKLFILAPVLYACFLFFVVENRERTLLRDDERGRILLPLFLLLGSYFLISAAWPIAKFRYLIPALPLVFLLGSYYVVHYVPSGPWRTGISVASIALVVAGSVLTFFSTPSHTYYYDGAITTDIFGRHGELEFIQSRGALPAE